jgi:HEAT repeat protein
MIDPEVVALREKEDERICQALRFAGARISSIFDLVNTRAPYPELISALIEILPSVQDTVMREGVVRALTTKEARGKAGPSLVTEFRRPEASFYRWTVGNALSVVATADLFDQIAALVVDQNFGTARQMLPLALVRSNKRRAEQVLLPLLNDKDILPHVVRELGKLRSHAALPRLEELASHPVPLVRAEVKKALARISAG